MASSIGINMHVGTDTPVKAVKVESEGHPDLGFVKFGDLSNVMLIGSLVEVRQVLINAITAVDTLRMEHYARQAALAEAEAS